VVLMGCDGLAAETIAEALVDKGAKAVVSWNGLVSASHTDSATEHLLRYFVTEGLPLREAVDKTAAELGPDPSYGSVLRRIPRKAARCGCRGARRLFARGQIAGRESWRQIRDVSSRRSRLVDRSEVGCALLAIATVLAVTVTCNGAGEPPTPQAQSCTTMRRGPPSRRVTHSSQERQPLQ
jgi:hypothetical protein